MTVHEDDTLAPCFHVDECIAGFIQSESTFVQYRTILQAVGLRSAVVVSIASHLAEIRHFAHRELVHFPITADFLSRDSYRADDTLGIVNDFATVVDTAHVFYQNLESSIERNVDFHVVSLGVTVQFAHLFAIDVDDSIVTQARDRQRTADRLVETAAIQYVTITLVQLFESQRLVSANRSHAFCPTQYIGHLIQFDGRYFNHRNTCRSFRNILHVVLDDGTDRIVLRSYPSCFADRRIVVVAGQVRLDVTTLVVVGTASESEVRTTMNHVEVDGNIVLQVQVCLTGNAGSTYIRMRFSPVCQPTRIEFGYHVRTLATVILVDSILQVFDVAFTVGCRKCTRCATAFEQPATV